MSSLLPILVALSGTSEFSPPAGLEERTRPASEPAGASVAVLEGAHVVVGLVGHTGLVEVDVERTLRSYMRDVGVGVEVVSMSSLTVLEVYKWARHQAEIDGVTVVFWFEATTTDNGVFAGRLHLLQRDAADRVYVRELSVEGEGRAEMMMESLAAIIRASTTSSGGGPPSGLRPLELPPQLHDVAPDVLARAERDAAAEPVASEPEPGAREVSVGVGYRGGTLDIGRLAWQQGVAAEIELGGGQRGGALGSVAWAWVAWPALRGVVPLEIRRHELAVRAGYRFAAARRFAIELAGGAAAERFAWSAILPQAAIVRGSTGLKLRAAVTLDGSLRWGLTPRIGVTVRVRATAWLLNLEITVQRDGESDRYPVLFPGIASGDTYIGVFYTF
ncbi:MAG: hypothetical protein V3V08_10955 [Nannocystaceae bacterium]